jgi:hypothetical protein
MKREKLINGRTMNAYEFYKYKTKHDLKENCGVRLTGEELFTIMNQFVAHCMSNIASHPEPIYKHNIGSTTDFKVQEESLVVGPSEEIIKDLKEFNPYPETVFIPIPDEKLQAVVKLLKGNGYSSDSLYGNWGRTVWNNCCEKLESLLQESQLKPGYPKEFVEWTFQNIEYIRYSDKCYIIGSGLNDMTLDELYEYWKEQIRNKDVKDK